MAVRRSHWAESLRSRDPGRDLRGARRERKRQGRAAVTANFESGIDRIRAGEFFEAHEELELAWRAADPGERDFFQGLVHVAVAWYQAGRGNRYGCARQLAKALRRLAPYAPAHRGIDIASLLAQLERAQAVVAAGSLELDAPVV